jgi:hypothetical protein
VQQESEFSGINKESWKRMYYPAAGNILCTLNSVTILTLIRKRSIF